MSSLASRYSVVSSCYPLNPALNLDLATAACDDRLAAEERVAGEEEVADGHAEAVRASVGDATSQRQGTD